MNELYELRDNILNCLTPLDAVMEAWNTSNKGSQAVAYMLGMADAFRYANLITPEQYTQLYKMVGL